MPNLILLAVLTVVIAAAARYVYKEKKRGAKCIGCPAARDGSCSGGCSGGAPKAE